MNKSNDGCIYTRPWVVDFMLDACGYTEQQPLSAWRVVEPSCGEGSFVLRMAERLIASARRDGVDMAQLNDAIRAYDTDAGALAVARANTLKLLEHLGVEAVDAEALVEAWFVHQDFIEAECLDVDLVIGNPPYVRATDIDESIRERYQNLLETFTRGTDLYIAFFEKGLKSLKEGGRLCFICSDRWRRNQFGAKLRAFIAAHAFGVRLHCQMHGVDAFESQVTAYPAVTLIDRSGEAAREVVCDTQFDAAAARQLARALARNEAEDGASYVFQSDAQEEKYAGCPLITDAGVEIGIGIATGRDNVFVTTDEDAVESERMVPLAYARDIEDNQFPQPVRHWLVNPWQDGKLVNLADYPRLSQYFYENEASLKKRHVAQKKPSDWYRTIDKLKPGLCESKKLLIRDMSDKTEPIYDDGELYPHHNLYWMTSETWDLKVLGGILISDAVYDMMSQNSVDMRGGVIRNQAQYLRKLRVPRYEGISPADREALRRSFERNDRAAASRICERLYA
ncbi:Eco57I restriction-modification methylase domain-containing protein [uncultured Selenomonas sp.]|uniref:Eco57I restriction-modification methylase domain-containing protein n=1 Tax=uncultured Selenomonas sp. TaxID=159275 RepID=UPI0025CDF6FD|nr:Eco57I restriction-modification methylase domain-containing protein [uncultured Selenomonas sp.]